MVQDLERVRYVTQNYESLQGLKFVPWAMWLVLTGVAAAFWFEPPSGFFDVAWLRDLVLGAGAVLCWVLYFRAAGYYDRRFGKVIQRRRRKNSGRDFALFIGVVVLMLLASPLIERLGETATSVYAGCVLAGFILYLWWERRHRLIVHWPILAALTVVVGFLPAVATLPGHGISLLSLPVGLLLVAGLLLDHLVLVRTLKAVPEEGGDG